MDTADMNEEPKPIRAKVRDTILQSLRAGVVPRRGLEHVQVGRAREVEALLADIERVADGGSAIRFVIGEYGSGKTFFMHLVRSIALEKKLVATTADLTPDRRLQASGGQARALYAELMRGLSTRSKPDGGALAGLVERFVESARKEAESSGSSVDQAIAAKLAQLAELAGGYDFAQVIEAYWRGHEVGDEELQASAIRWLRAEYETKTEARAALGVRAIIDDSNVYEHLKLMARFCRLAGYDGLLVCMDEMVNLYKLASGRARNANYERVLSILNDALQGESVGLGVLFAGTPEFLSDTRRGLYSYEALQSRLADNQFAKSGLVDFTGPVLRLASLTPEELFVLLSNILAVQAGGDPEAHLLPDEGIHAFMAHCSEVLGDAYFRTPRSTVKSFVSLLAVLEQNPSANWSDLIGGVELERENVPALDDEVGDGDKGDLASFRL